MKITILMLSLVALPAFADGADKMPPVTLQGIQLDNLPPEIRACLKQAEIGKQRVAVKKAKVADLRKKADAAKGSDKAKAKAEVQKESQELAKLESQLKDLAQRLTDVEEALKLKADGRNMATLKDIVIQGSKIEILLADVRDLKKEVAELERQLNFVQIGPRLGAMAWRSNDKTSYIGGLLGARLTLRGEGVNVFVEPFAAFGLQNCPVSLGIKGGVEHVFENGLSLEAGALGSAHSINNMLKAKSALLALDLGVGFRPGKSGLVLGLSLLLGAEFDQGNPAFAFGGQGTIGWDF